MRPTYTGIARATLLGVMGIAAVPSGALAQKEYTVCRIPDVNKADRDNWDWLCAHPSLVAPGGAARYGDASVSLTVPRNGRDFVVLSVPAMNCRKSEGRVYGGVSIVVDSSKSIVTTDPRNERLTAVREVLRAIEDDARGHPLANTDPEYPKVGVVSYGGRKGIDGGFDTDGLNRRFTEQACLDGDGDAVTEKFDSTGARARWQEKVGGTLVSQCEFLRPVGADVATGATATSPSMDRLGDFLEFTGANPRGATDLSYFSRAIAEPKMLRDLPSRARNAIVITDGLPNIPKYVPAERCRELSYLKGERIVTVKDSTGKAREVCIYRQAQAAADKANAYLDDNAAAFKAINQYNVLFAPEDKVYYDEDSKGRIYPPDFLIENSARTGNGKVKFAWAKSKEDLTRFIDETLARTFDRASLQRVEVTMNPAGGGAALNYNAVSPADTVEGGKPFSIKFIGLKTGDNVANVRFVYSDSTFERTYNIKVTDAGAPDAPFSCTGAATDKTVDGDALDEKNPKGDGVKAEPEGGTQDRVLRNSDEANAYDRERLGPSNGNSGAANGAGPASGDGEKDPRKLRIQGGTGNCGVIAGGTSAAAAAVGASTNGTIGASGASGASDTRRSAIPVALALLAAPLAFALNARRRDPRRDSRDGR